MHPALREDNRHPDEHHGSSLNNRDSIEIKDGEQQLTVQAAIPGFGPEQMDVSIHGDLLFIRAERRHVRRIEREGRQWQEFSHRRYSRAVKLPGTAKAEAAGASFGDGILTVTIPKGEPEPPKRIEVTKQ